MASKRKEIESSLSKGTSEAARLHVYIHHYMSLLYKRYLNQKQKIMNMGMKNVSKEMIQMLIALPLKSWSKPSTLIVILWQCNGATDLIGDFVVKSAMSRGVHGMVWDSCLEQYLDLSKDNNACFQIKMVYDLLKHRFMYENKDKIDEVWINYYGMLVCFGWKEFAIVTGLKCCPPSPSQVIPIVTLKKAPRTPKKFRSKSSDVMNSCPLLVQASKTKI
ncbi:hypothetical protein FXO38_06776 [Capsicum annuum]|nr:hypothetical protein FXO38_06776 [Capsicum annuum]